MTEYQRGEYQSEKSYLCADRGTTRCPCHLMAAGQCYTCTMSRTGVCDCDGSAGWQGVCPYTEFYQQSKVAKGPAKSVMLEVVGRHGYSPDLVVMTLKGGTGFAIQCLQPGAYVMVDAFAEGWRHGWRTPLSVLAAHPAAGTVDFLVRPVGPKTAWLADEKRKRWLVTGPFHHGILHGEALGRGRDTLAIVRGTALAPYLCAMQGLGLAEENPSAAGEEGGGYGVKLYLDTAGLTDSFLADYLVGQPYTGIDLNDAETLYRMKKTLLAAVGRNRETTAHTACSCGDPCQPDAPAAPETKPEKPEKQKQEKPGKPEKQKPEKPETEQNVLLLVSPYFAKKLLEDLTEAELARVVYPNTANLCCGEGICGACAYTDADGQTVRLCKCHELVLE